MSYQVLARKWRPKRFEEVVGQEHVTRSLQNSLKSGKLAHAYLFTGTRGVGKTSIARLFAKAIRCENRSSDMNPCLQCISCKDIEAGNSLDYLEIDGASNNSVDNIRELIENVRYLPARGAYKLYVIDEVHMLSTAAFNALLKTLEEPPAHALFVFATTDAHKLLGTVLSRCQRFDFKNVTLDVLAKHIRFIADQEKIVFTDPSLVLKLAEYGKGSVRDTLSLFDQVLSLAGENSISESVFYQSLGLAKTGAIRDLIGFILCENPSETSALFQNLLQENIELKRIIDQMLESFYSIIQKIDNSAEVYQENLLPENALSGITYSELFWIYETFTKDCGWALSSPAPEKVVDLVLQKLARRRQMLSPDRAVIKNEKPSVKIAPAKVVSKPKELSPKIEMLIEAMSDAPTIKANLELGDFLKKPELVEGTVYLTIGFPEEESMPMDYLQDLEVAPKLRHYAAKFYGVEETKINIKYEKVTAEEMERTGFSTVHQREMRKQQSELEDRRGKILNDPFVKEAERLFNAKVDKVILKDQKL
ncbi:MAG: DNA polymerase III subunit gamma/tau [Bacteriovoracaceae bacterium]|nr:DNA polymerase III subunit gamma/tau [Bacteriovoracaceae bacterium]